MALTAMIACGGETDRDQRDSEATSSGGNETGSGGESSAAGGDDSTPTGGSEQASSGGSSGSESSLEYCGSPGLDADPNRLCDEVGLSCRCPHDLPPECQPIATCNGVEWEIAYPECDPPDPTPCPATIDDAHLQRCNTLELTCAYESQVTCQCFHPSGVGRTGEWSCGLELLIWYCGEFDRDSACPKGIPEIGSPCDSEGLECGWACGNHLAHECHDGQWAWSEPTGECV
jgi:hypothetical protein